jgi:tRNA pseudouridine55 synthase
MMIKTNITIEPSTKLRAKLNEGIVAIYKPKGKSSHWVINLVRRITGIKKVGHAGTLDPLAEGVLVVAIGREFTKKINTELKKEKEYLATIKLGEVSTTDDEEGEKKINLIDLIPNDQKIKEVICTFVGNIWQRPPIYSAIKVRGHNAYEYARKGQEIRLEKRERFIRSIDVLEYDYPLLKLKVITGPGVYIRSLARDLGEKLGTGGYLAGLVRTRVGEFTIKEAIKIESYQ